MTELHLDLDVTRRFLRALVGGEGDDIAVHWQTFSDRKDLPEPELKALARQACLKLGQAERWLAQANERGAGIFVTVNRTDGLGREIANVVALRALFVDCDGTRPLPAAWPLAPSIVVQRDATHWHAYWLLKAGAELSLFECAQAQMAGHWATDTSMCDLPRVMRVPGFLHRKADPVPVSLVHADGSLLYALADVLAAHPVADWSALSETHQRKAERLGLWTRPSAPSRAVAPSASAQMAAGASDEAIQAEYYRRWARAKETTEGGANPNGGRDNAAFAIACEGAGRGFDQGLVSEVVIEYLQRAGVPRPEVDAQRIVGSAFSKPREGHRPVVRRDAASANREASRSAAPSAAEDLFGGGGGGDPPAAATASPAQPDPEGPWDNLNLDVISGKWSILLDGVAPIEFDARQGHMMIKVNKRISNLPIWPAQLGRDVATGKSFMRVGWLTPQGEPRHAWLPEDDVKEGRPLLKLSEGPIAGTRWQAAAVWLTEARPAIRRPMVDVTSRLGWCGVNGSRRWVWPGVGEASRASFIGDPLPAHGKLEGWKAGLDHLLTLPDGHGFVALICAALSAAAPLARLLTGQRNPVIGLQARSSSGKGSALCWVLAMWGDADALTLPASSTSKGLQDRATQYPDLPIFLDELQQLAEQYPAAASDAVYFLANGQRRVTSSKAQVSVGGEARRGVGFYAAEAPVLPGLNRGVQYRVFEIQDDPCPDEATARVLRQAGQHSGVLAEPISRLIQSRSVTEWIDLLRETSADIKTRFGGLEAGDGDVLALVQLGCTVLEHVCGYEELAIPVRDLVAWGAARIAQQRTSSVDRETLCLQQVLDWLCNLQWAYEADSGERSMRTQVNLQSHCVAWSTWIAGQDGMMLRGSLDCDPTQRDLAQLFERYGGERRVLPAWAARGWIEKQGAHLKVKRRGSTAGRVVVFTRQALIEHLGSDEVAAPVAAPEAVAGEPA